MLNKKWEKFLLIACASWQFIDGAITIILGFIQPAKINELQQFSHAVPLSSFNGAVGSLFILTGLVNLLIALYFLKQKPIHKMIVPVLIIQILFAYVCLDIISVATLVPATVIICLKKRVQQANRR